MDYHHEQDAIRSAKNMVKTFGATPAPGTALFELVDTDSVVITDSQLTDALAVIIGTAYAAGKAGTWE